MQSLITSLPFWDVKFYKETDKSSWPYFVIDNFLIEKHFNYLNSLKLMFDNGSDLKIHHNKIDRTGNIENSCLSKDFIREFQETYHESCMSILHLLSPQKTILYEYSDIHVVLTGKNKSFPIHDDIPQKLLSIVVYLDPEVNSGTKIHKSKTDQNPIEIDWELNRGFLFSRNKNKTWHSYNGDGKNDRLALVYNLMTTKTLEVARSEGRNFLSYFIKEKLLKL